MQRGAIVHDREYLSKEDFYAGTKIELTEAEVSNFHFGSTDVATLVNRLRPKVRAYARNGYRKPVDVSRLLNRDGLYTACGERWSPRLAWFLLRLMFETKDASHRQSGGATSGSLAKPKKGRLLKPVNAVAPIRLPIGRSKQVPRIAKRIKSG